MGGSANQAVGCVRKGVVYIVAKKFNFMVVYDWPQKVVYHLSVCTTYTGNRCIIQLHDET